MISKNKVFWRFLLLGFLVGPIESCSQRPPLPHHTFSDEIRLKTTPVKNQGSSDLCWVYALLATIETERLMVGDSVNLSPIFLARCFMEEQAEAAFRQKKGAEAFSHRGMATTALHLLHRHGAQPYDYYHAYQQADVKALEKRIKRLISNGLEKNIAASEFRRQLDELLDEKLGFVPQFVHMLGAEYTSAEFGRSVCLDDEYEALTSFTHHPYGERFALEVPDNQFNSTFLNVPLDTLMAHIDRALFAGHPVCWEGDISESGFSFKDGLADVLDEAELKKQSDNTLQTLRQREFEHDQTTDDHTMALVGIARDENGRRYYIAKNSQGTDNPFGGFMYLSENYVRLKTICIVLPKAAVSPFPM
ncbi:MAG: cysteine protease [Prevotella sp.]|nr:cysteine protease [Prevotella sp.]